MAVVNTNVGASIAQAALMRNERALNTAMERLSTGNKVNSARDDASGLAVSVRMESQIRGLSMAIRNANDAIGMISTGEGALIEITNMLQRMRELAVQAGSGTTDSTDRGYLNTEFSNLRAEIDRIADNTEWNGRTILDHKASGGASGQSGKVSFVVGMDPSQKVEVEFGNFTNTASGTFVTLASATISASNTTLGQTNASVAVGRIDTALDAVSSQRATFGAAMNQLTYSIDNLTNIKTNTEAARSQIVDTDYAAETSELARAQIIQQAGTAMLAQANQLPQTVLSLLQ
jgi:flagellin